MALKGLLTSWLAAHLVQAAAGTDTAADEDEENDDAASDTKDHGQRCKMRAIDKITKRERKKNIMKNSCLYVNDTE